MRNRPVKRLLHLALLLAFIAGLQLSLMPMAVGGVGMSSGDMPAGYESDMPAFDGVLSDAQIAAALAYIKSRWPAEIRARQAQINHEAAQP